VSIHHVNAWGLMANSAAVHCVQIMCASAHRQRSKSVCWHLVPLLHPAT
jgi:hypothetical protein